ncbi:MAG: helix-turn-helix domain-containing protein [Planctomycetota bacterium]|jgi:transposase|nr:MAG: helix-turn-helix domain-containing protein [Planctomycetota bacterium]
MTVVDHHSLDELRARFERETDPRQSKRIWIIWQARQGRTEPQITAAVGMSRRAVQSWVHRYNLYGLEGLVDRPGRGRKPILSDEQRRFVAQWLDQQPRSQDADSLRGVDIQQFIQQHFGKLLSLSAVYDLRHQLVDDLVKEVMAEQC